MNKILASTKAIFMLLLILSGCSPITNQRLDSSAIRVVSTIFPPYDFVREIAGELADISMLLPPGSESHSFEPTPQDIIKIQNSDVFIYVGGDSDAWVEDILSSMDTSNMTIISLMDCVDALEEELTEGMEDDHDHDHVHHEEIDPATIEDRPLSDFNGSWISAIPLLQEGHLSAYVSQLANESGISVSEQYALLQSQWATEYEELHIEGDYVHIGTQTARYSYHGYTLQDMDHGSTVWYQYVLTEVNANFPTYLMLQDHHHTPNEDEDHDHHDDEEIRHFHLRYGNEDLDSLLKENQNAAYYFDYNHSLEDIGAYLSNQEETEEEHILDEHVWTSPANAKRIVQAISNVLINLDGINTHVYEERTTQYLSKLDALDEEFRTIVSNSKRQTIIFGDRFPFRYFADAYGLTYFAAFPGCSTQTEASAATVAFLIDKVKSEQIPVVFHIELSNQKMANIIAESTGANVRLLHSVHNITKDEFKQGIGYLDLMKQNAITLKEAMQ